MQWGNSDGWEDDRENDPIHVASLLVNCEMSHCSRLPTKSLGMKQINRGKVAGFILRALGHTRYGIELSESGVTVLASSPKDIPFSELANPLKLTNWLWFRGVSLSLTDSSSINVLGVTRAEAAGFVETAIGILWWQPWVTRVEAA